MALIETLSGPLTKARSVNSTRQSFEASDYLLSALEPIGEGIFDNGKEGAYAANRLFIQPYAIMAPGGQFSLRVLGWHLTNTDNFTRAVWVQFGICELLCTVGSIPGPDLNNPYQPQTLLPTELLCDDISVVQGGRLWTDGATTLVNLDGSLTTLPGLGKDGGILSFGAGSGVPAAALVDMRGCQKFQFHFAGDGNGTMNAFFRKA